jgi:hypothetical protein
MMGIDQLLQQKMDVGRQNPQSLMQSYQQNQSLLDLLALQKLKSEKEAAQRDMMLKAAQSGTPPTVAQQREQEMLELSKSEIAQQAAGSMQHQQAQQQEALQRMAQAGIANLPTPGMGGMAQGGIVGYQEGGDVEREIVGYDDEGRPIYYADDLTRGEELDDSPEGIARRLEYNAIRDRGIPALRRLSGEPDYSDIIRQNFERTQTSRAQREADRREQAVPEGAGPSNPSMRGARVPRSQREDQRTGFEKARDALFTASGEPSPLREPRVFPKIGEFLRDQGAAVRAGQELELENLISQYSASPEAAQQVRSAQRRPGVEVPTPAAPAPATGAFVGPTVRQPESPDTSGIEAILSGVTQGATEPPVPFRMQGVQDAPSPAEWLKSQLPRAQAEPAGLSALQEEIARRKAMRGDKLDYLSRFMMGMAGSTSPGSAMQRGSAMARGIEGQEEGILRDLMKEQERVELEQRRLEEMGLDRTSRERIEADRISQMALDRDENRKLRFAQQSEAAVNRALNTLVQVANLSGNRDERYRQAMFENLGETPQKIAAIHAELATKPGKRRTKELNDALNVLQAQFNSITNRVDEAYGNDETTAQLKNIQMELLEQLARMGTSGDPEWSIEELDGE